jgi:hypothetical protein
MAKSGRGDLPFCRKRDGVKPSGMQPHTIVRDASDTGGIMGIRTTITLDDDVLDSRKAPKARSRSNTKISIQAPVKLSDRPARVPESGQP